MKNVIGLSLYLRFAVALSCPLWVLVALFVVDGVFIGMARECLK